MIFIFALIGCQPRITQHNVAATAPPPAPVQTPQATPAETLLTFSDPVIEAQTRSILGKPEGGIATEDVLRITVFDMDWGREWRVEDKPGQITTLDDFKWFKNLQELRLFGYEINSLSGIEGLTELRTLNVRRNNITSLEPVRALVNLVSLDCADNNISDYSALSGLTSLEELCIGDNGAPYTDISALKGLINLKRLYAPQCGISDISVLRNMPGLEYLQLVRNNISNIDSLKSLEKLSYLELGANSIADIGPIEQLTKLEHVGLYGNPIPEDVLDRFFEPKPADYGTTTIRAKINDSMPEFVFELYSYFDKRVSGYAVQTLTITDSASGETLQRLSIPELTLFGQTNVSIYDDDLGTMGLTLEDLNFDGYKDIRLSDTGNGNFLTEWIYLVWNKDKSIFENDKRLNDIPMAEFSQQTKTIHGMDRDSAVDHWYYTYQYINEEITLVELITDNAIDFKRDVTDEQLAGLVPALAGHPSVTSLYHTVQKLNRNTMQMETTEAKYRFYISNIWELLAEYDAGSETGKEIEALIDWGLTGP